MPTNRNKTKQGPHDWHRQTNTQNNDRVRRKQEVAVGYIVEHQNDETDLKQKYCRFWWTEQLINNLIYLKR